MIQSHEDSDRSKLTSLYRSGLLSDYVNFNLLAFQYLRNRTYKTAMSTFEKCIEISRELDDVKHVESLTNFGICQYFCGKFLDSHGSLDRAREISNRLIENYINDKSIQYLHLRVLCNLSLTSLSLNKIPDCKSYFNNCLELIKSQLEIPEKIKMLKELVYIFFRIDSLQNYYEQNIEAYKEANNVNGNNNTKHQEQDVDNSMMNQKMISKTLFSLHRTLRENNIDYWMKCLNDEAKKLRSLKDINGYVFVLINSFAANFYQSGKVSEGVKTNFSKILKIYAEQYNKDLKLKEKNLNVIFTDFKNRIDLAIEIYKKLLDTEAELNNLLTNFEHENDINDIDEIPKNEIDYAVSNKIFIKLFFKHALRQLDNAGSSNENNVENNLMNPNPNNSPEMKSQIELALKLLENDEFDFSKLNIFNINSEVTKSLKILFENLIAIRNKYLVSHYFKDYMKKTFGYYDIIFKREMKIEAYMEQNLGAVCKGNVITKVHYSSSGFSKYFYIVDQTSQNLLIFKTEKAFEENREKPYKKIPFAEIKEIVYGLSTLNLKKRYKSLNEKKLNSSWLFLSLILSKRSIDFYFEKEETLMNWFYGLKHFIKSKSIEANVPTLSQFILKKLKLKLIAKLKQIADKVDSKVEEKNPDPNPNPDGEGEGDGDGNRDKNTKLTILSQLKNYITTNEMGFHALTFIQVLLLYKKINEKQGSN